MLEIMENQKSKDWCVYIDEISYPITISHIKTVEEAMEYALKIASADLEKKFVASEISKVYDRDIRSKADKVFTVEMLEAFAETIRLKGARHITADAWYDRYIEEKNIIAESYKVNS